MTTPDPLLPLLAVLEHAPIIDLDHFMQVNDAEGHAAGVLPFMLPRQARQGSKRRARPVLVDRAS